MFTELLVPVLVVGLVVLAVEKARGTGAFLPPDGHAIRRLFQYALLFGLAVVVAIGLAGLLGRLLDGPLLARSDQAGLARDLAFAVVGVPLLAGVVLWSRRILVRDPDEARSLGWATYVTAASLTSLAMAATGADSVLRWAVGLQSYTGSAPAQLIVWGGMWVAHRWVDGRTTPREHARVHHLAGSLIGLVTAAVGLGDMLAGALRELFGLGTGTLLAAGAGNPVLPGLVAAVTGAAVWWIYWVRTVERSDRAPLWYAYVLLAGVAGGVTSAIVAASALGYSGLVWLLGDPGSRDAAVHFAEAPARAAAAVVGVLVWWYHQAVLRGAGPAARTEVTRVYEYVMAGIGLLAAAGGLTALVAAVVDAAAGAAFAGGSVANSLLAGVTLLAVGGPVWWLYWRRIRLATRAAPTAEAESPTRRVYLAVLFGLGAVAAVVALVTAVYLLFTDVVDGSVGVETLRRMRFALGVLLSAPAISGYHWTVRREGHRHLPSAVPPAGPSFALLIGPADAATAREVARRTGARIEVWSRIDDHGPDWSPDDVVAALAAAPAGEVIVLSQAGELRAVPVRRRPDTSTGRSMPSRDGSPVRATSGWDGRTCTFDLAVDVRRPPEAVHALLVDVQDAEPLPRRAQVRMTKDPRGRTAVGTRWDERVRLLPGCWLRIDSVVTDVDAPTRLGMDFTSRWFTGHLDYVVEPGPEGSVLRQRENLRPGPLPRLFGALVERRLRAHLEERMTDIRDLLERPDLGGTDDASQDRPSPVSAGDAG